LSATTSGPQLQTSPNSSLRTRRLGRRERKLVRKTSASILTGVIARHRPDDPARLAELIQSSVSEAQTLAPLKLLHRSSIYGRLSDRCRGDRTWCCRCRRRAALRPCPDLWNWIRAAKEGALCAAARVGGS